MHAIRKVRNPPPPTTLERLDAALERLADHQHLGAYAHALAQRKEAELRAHILIRTRGEETELT